MFQSMVLECTLHHIYERDIVQLGPPASAYLVVKNP